MDNLIDYEIGVIGAGSWGTTLANMLADKGLKVTLWVYEKELLARLNTERCNTFYLPDVELHQGLLFTHDIEEAVADKKIVLWVTPVKAFGNLFSRALPFTTPATIHASASKGIENEKLKTISQIAEEKSHKAGNRNFVVISGPSFAQDVSRRMPTAVVVASRDKEKASFVQKMMATPYFRTYTSEDVLGVELGGALKNVIAIASGIIEGLGYGQNSRAALITRGLAEIIRLGRLMGADARTFAGLSGIGDLVLTCTSTLSRNYSVGLEIGKGKTLDEVLNNMTMVAEGVYTTKSAFSLSQRFDIEMPIVHEINKVLFENKAPFQAVKDLMGRDLTQEII